MLQSRVVVAMADGVEIRQVTDKLRKGGYLVVSQVRQAKEVLRVAFQIHPDVIILDNNLPDYSGLGIMQVLDEQRVAPVVLVADNPEQVIIRVRSSWVSGYVIRPYEEWELYLAIEVAMANYDKLNEVEQENIKLKKMLEARKVIEKAKGLLMEYRGLTEQAAFHYLQKLSMDQSRSLAKVAKDIIKWFENQC